jgi:hypothetical protein
LQIFTGVKSSTPVDKKKEKWVGMELAGAERSDRRRGSGGEGRDEREGEKKREGALNRGSLLHRLRGSALRGYNEKAS